MTKEHARSLSLARRAARPSTDVAVAGAALAAAPWSDLVRGSAATCYVSMAGEPPTDGIIARLEELGIRVALPIMRPGRRLDWGWHSGHMTRNGYGVLEPEVDAAFDLTEVSALVIPALRAGRDGSRLGRGAGYYDRALAHVPRSSDGGPVRIAVVFDDELVESVPHEDFDAPVDVVVTPTEVVRVETA